MPVSTVPVVDRVRPALTFTDQCARSLAVERLAEAIRRAHQDLGLVDARTLDQLPPLERAHYLDAAAIALGRLDPCTLSAARAYATRGVSERHGLPMREATAVARTAIDLALLGLAGGRP